MPTSGEPAVIGKVNERSLYRDRLEDARGYLQRAWSRQAWTIWLTISRVIVPYAILYGLGGRYVVAGRLTIGPVSL